MSHVPFVPGALRRSAPLACSALVALLVHCGGGGGGSTNNNTPPPSTDQAPVITAAPTDQTVVFGNSATFSVTATGTPTPEYQWERKGKQIQGATQASLNVPGVQLTDDGTTYDVIVHNSAGNVKSAAATLHVKNTPGNYLVKFLAASSTAGSISGSWIQSVAAGASTTPVTASPASGCQFYNWTCSDGTTSASNPLTVANVQKDLTFTANFAGSNVGCRAADIPGIDTTGASVKMLDYAGKVIVLDISAQWCPHCQDDAPLLEKLYNQYASRGLQVITVLSEDNNSKLTSQAVLQSWASTYGLTFRVMNDTSASSPKNGVAESVYVSNAASGGFPTFVVIDKNFVVQYIMGGYDEAAVKAKVEALLAQ